MARRKVLLVEEAAARLERPAARVEVRGKRKAVKKAAEPVTNKPVRSVGMQLAAEVDRLRAELEAAHLRMAELETCADIDVLLNMLNRRAFERELRRSAAYVRRHGTPAALVYLDLNHFKPVNDRHGHAVGDSLLQAVAKTLQRTVRESDVVARLGGDEFGVLLWNISEIQAAAKARELEAAVAGTIVMYAGAAISVGVSAGYAVLGSEDEPKDVISRADLAMYARKRAARAAVG
jgi:diguanylate cyclase (GGDEF)-like protein